MSSFVGRLARTFSQSTAGNDGTHRRATSTPEALEIPGSHVQEVKPRMSISPSFNDFSLRAEEDAAEELGWFGSSWSMGGSVEDATKTPESVVSVGDATDSIASGSPTIASSLLPTAAASSVSPGSAPIPVAKSRRRTRIMGMDAYDYCDLVRSSSL